MYSCMSCSICFSQCIFNHHQSNDVYYFRSRVEHLKMIMTLLKCFSRYEKKNV